MKHHSPISKETLKKIKQITIQTKRLLRGSMAGDERSAIKGTGFEFDQIREYQFGDDVRFIDWKASSRLDTLLVKQYIEERRRTVLIALDMSASEIMGSKDTLKRDILAEVASVLALVAASGKDRVGVLLFTDHVEKYIPPASGIGHAHTIMYELYGFKPTGRKTNISAALKKIAQYRQKDAITFILSDFIDTAIDPKILSLVARKHDLYAIRCLDQHEKQINSFGFIPFEDPETDEHLTVDLRGTNNAVSSYLQNRLQSQNKLFTQKGVKIIDVKNDHTFIGDLIRFFRRRMQY